MIGGVELLARGILACQKTEAQGCPDNDSDAALEAQIEQAVFDRTLIKQIEVDLQAFDSESGDRGEAVFGRSHRDSEGADFAISLQGLHAGENSTVLVEQLDRRTVELV